MDIWQPRDSAPRGRDEAGDRARAARTQKLEKAGELDGLRAQTLDARVLKDRSEAISGAAARMGGLLICQAAMPLAARNNGSIRKRVSSS